MVISEYDIKKAETNGLYFKQDMTHTIVPQEDIEDMEDFQRKGMDELVELIGVVFDEDSSTVDEISNHAVNLEKYVNVLNMCVAQDMQDAAHMLNIVESRLAYFKNLAIEKVSMEDYSDTSDYDNSDDENL